MILINIILILDSFLVMIMMIELISHYMEKNNFLILIIFSNF
ncbi:protein of unknown function [Shewanella benthica]|uniref:Uncharacterized protein n=1 Tax=Shewanella benthica TaxID=43661 RepID=A0A330M4K3_9GAMM|nr:protein of unknown function [Shewanella benthica]